jgi:hypothetical protein
LSALAFSIKEFLEMDSVRSFSPSQEFYINDLPVKTGSTPIVEIKDHAH